MFREVYRAQERFRIGKENPAGGGGGGGAADGGDGEIYVSPS